MPVGETLKSAGSELGWRDFKLSDRDSTRF